MKKKLKVGIIGCGRVALHYAKLIKKNKIKYNNISCLSDIVISKANNLSKIIGGKVYKDYIKMILENKIDVALVLTPSGTHYQICKKLLEHNINVICEKPLTMTPSKSLELYKIAKKKKIMCGVMFQNRFNPAIQILKEAVDKNKFGKIVKVSVSLLWCRFQKYYNDSWHGTWKNDGGVINQQAIHHVDILRWLFGPIKKVNCIMTKRINKLQAEDTAVAIIKFSNGSLGTIEATTAARPTDLHASISIVGEKGTSVISGLAMNKIKVWKFVNLDKKKEKEIIKKNSSEVSNGYGLSHVTYLNKAFKTLLNKKIEAPVSAYEAFLTSILVHSLYKSSELKKAVNLSLNLKSNKLGLNN
jgi:UDP-N-acetyl-2-amino-2-deoxyglucuronate dehydrogenase